MFDLSADLQTFFNPNEFSSAATITLPGGTADITGTASTYTQRERAASNTNSGISQFMVGAADFNLRSAQFMTAWAPVATAQPECQLVISDGDHAGTWRVRAIERDGDIAVLVLNQQ